MCIRDSLKNATTDQVDIGGFFSGDKAGTPASQSGDPQQAWFFVAALTSNFTTNTTNDIHYSFLRNWWAWSRAGDTIQIPGLGGAMEVGAGESASQDLAPYNVNTQQTRTRFWDAVSYTHLDVYKRQRWGCATRLRPFITASAM